MKPTRFLVFTALACMTTSLIGCGEPAPPAPPAPPKDEHKALQRAIQEPLDKARAVESQLQEKNEQLQRELDDAQD